MRMLRLASSATVYFTWSMWPGERYAGSPWAISRRPGERLMMKMPFADRRSRSRLIRCRTSAGSVPFQLWKGCIAPYSRGGALKFAATSRVDGTVTCCHGRASCASNIGASDIGTDSETRQSFRANFISNHSRVTDYFLRQGVYVSQPTQVANIALCKVIDALSRVLALQRQPGFGL